MELDKICECVCGYETPKNADNFSQALWTIS